MKVAVCSTGDTLDSPTDPRFGRCACFVVVDTETFDATAVGNPGVRSAQGAGVQAAQVISSLGVSAVITGNVGPNAHQALSSAGIKVYQCAGETVRYAVDFCNAGALQEICAPTVAAHSGMNAAPGQGFGQGRGMGMGRGGGGGRGRGMGQGGGRSSG
jgi:predicted Fe-Mo cluster-binding NifX family protein